MTNVRIERFDLGQGVEPLLPLIRTEYSQGEMADARFLSWEYLDNPAGGAEITVARAEDGQLAGQYVVIPMAYSLSGRSAVGSLSLNTLTHRDFRGQGLFTKMALQTYENCAAREIGFTTGFPNKNSYPGFVKKLGFRHIGNPVFVATPLRPLRAAIGLLRRAARPKYESYQAARELRAGSPVRMGEVTVDVLDLESDEAAYTDFWTRRRTLYHQTDRTFAFLRWRYDRVPTRNYLVLKAVIGEDVLAIAVLRLRVVFGEPLAFLVDFCCLGGAAGRRAADALLKVAKRIASDHGAIGCGSLVSPGTEESMALRRQLFVPAPKQLLPHDVPFIVRTNGGEEVSPRLNSMDRWFLTLGDYDAF